MVELKGLRWTREDFCRGWLITGDTGSGKTRSGITPLLYQVFKNEPNWGGLCIDDKGLYWETLSEMAAHFNRQNDLILLQVKPDNAPLGLETTKHLQPHLRSQRPIEHLREIHRRHGVESWPAGRQRLFQKPGADAHRARLSTPSTKSRRT